MSVAPRVRRYLSRQLAVGSVDAERSLQKALHIDLTLGSPDADVCSEQACQFRAGYRVTDDKGEVSYCRYHYHHFLCLGSSEVTSSRLCETSAAVAAQADLRFITGEWFESASGWFERVDPFWHATIIEQAESGMANRAISRATGFHRNQILSVVRAHPHLSEAVCPCGQPRTHQGWCWVRFKNSAARQETMRLMHFTERAKNLAYRGVSFEEAYATLIGPRRATV